jgi:predicted ester cyclase
VRGIAAIRQTLQPYLIAFPDRRFTIEGQIAEADRVATRWTAQGTHQGPLMGHAATGRPVSFGGTDIFRIANGKIVEGWAHYDRFVILPQIGAVPAPHPSGP